MRLKTFFAPTLAEAMVAVRRDLGGEALIISTLEEKEGVRLTAAVEAFPSAGAEGNATCHGNKPTYAAEEVLEQLSRCLTHHGVPETLRETLLRNASEEEQTLKKGLSEILEHLFCYYPFSFQGAAPSLMMLVGLTGAGKSVTIAKLAAEALLAKQKVELVTLDVHKAGAFEQLSSYASIMNIPLHAAHTPEDLLPLIEKGAQGVQIFVDTPGVNHFCKDDMAFLSECILLTRQAPYWVMPAGGDVHETLDAAEAFKNIGVTGFIQTRSDSVRRHGALLAAMGGGHLRLTGISAGPTVGSRLIKGSSSALHTLLEGDKFKGERMEKIIKSKSSTEPDWLTRLREAKA